MSQETQIKINVQLDNERVPQHIEWSVSEDASGQMQATKAMMLAFFDKDSKDTLKIDLWTKEMQVMEMDRFFFQTLRSMADTYFKATQNKELSIDFQRFVQYFGEKTSIIPPSVPNH